MEDPNKNVSNMYERIYEIILVSLSIIYGSTLPQHEGKIMVSWQTFILVCFVTIFWYVLFHVNLFFFAFFSISGSFVICFKDTFFLFLL